MVDFPEKFFTRFIIGFIVLLFCAGTYGCSSDDPERLFQKGIDAMEAENADEAVIWFRKALQADPEMAIAYYKLGQLYHEKGDARQAFDALNRALQLEPKLKEARKEMVFLLVEHKSIGQAVEVCRQYLEINGDDKDIYLILGNSLAYTKKLDEAITVMKDAMAKYPDSTSIQLNLGMMLVVKGAVGEGRSLVEAVAQNHPDDIYLQLGLVQVYEKIERLDLAVQLLEQLKKDFPESPLPFLYLAQLSLKKRKPDEAKAIISDAESAGINDPGLFRVNAIIHHFQGDSATALKYFEKAVEVAEEGEKKNNQILLADYHIFLKNYKKAQEILEKIIAEDDSKNDLKSRIVELFLAQGQLEQARVSVESLLKENSGDARGHFLKGLMMMQDKNVVEAREEFSKAKELEPDVAENQFLYGMTFLDESQDVSINEISESLKKNPNLLNARMALAYLFFRNGDFQKSLDELDKIIEKVQTDSKARELRVAVMLKMNNPEAALRDAKFLVEVEPEVTQHVLRLAEVYFFTKEYDEALSLYKTIQKKTPESVKILNRIVKIHMLKEEFQQALAEVDSFLLKFPEKSQAVIVKAKIFLSLGDLDHAEQLLIPEANKDTSVIPFLMLAEIYTSKNENLKAEELYKKAVALLPDDIEIMMKMADFQLKVGANAKAIESYEKILQKKEDYLPAMNNLAFLYADDGENLDRALELANAVYKRSPENADVADTLGWILVLRKAYSQAEVYLQKAMKNKADSPTIIFHMGMLRFGQKQQEEAEALLKAAVEKGLGGNELVKANAALSRLEYAKKTFLAAKSEKEKGNARQAIALFESILKDEGFNGVVAAELVILYAEQGENIGKAIALAQKAYDGQPKNAQIADALGWAYYHQGSLLMAKRYIEQALKEDELYGPAQVHLAAVYLKKGELDAARESLKKAKALKLSVVEQKQLESLLLQLNK